MTQTLMLSALLRSPLGLRGVGLGLLLILLAPLPTLAQSAGSYWPAQPDYTIQVGHFSSMNEIRVNLRNAPAEHLPPLAHCEDWQGSRQSRWLRFVVPDRPGHLYFYTRYEAADRTPIFAFYHRNDAGQPEALACFSTTNADMRQDNWLHQYAYRFSELVPGDTVWIRAAEQYDRGDFDFRLGWVFRMMEPQSRSRIKTTALSTLDNYTCDEAICLVRGQDYTNRNRPYCYPCTGIWDPPNRTCSGQSSWGLMDNPVFYKFEVLPSTPQPVSITLNVTSCSGGSGTLQLGIWSADDCPGGGLDGFQRCADGINNVTVSDNLDDGEYFLVVDGGRGAECDWTFESNVSLQASSNSPICEGDDLELNVEQTAEGTQYFWTGPNGYEASTRNPIIPNAKAFQAGVYRLLAIPPTTTVCPDTFEVETDVIIAPRPNVDFLMDPPVICAGQTSQPVLADPRQPVDTWRWTFPGGVPGSSSQAQPDAVRWDSPGTVEVELTAWTVLPEGNRRCTNTSTLDMVINPQPTSRFSVSAIEVCPGQEVRIAYEGEAAEGAVYDWRCGQGPCPFTGPGPHTIRYDQTGTRFISLQVRTLTCASGTSEQRIVVTPAPQPEFVLEDQVCAEAETEIRLANQGSLNGSVVEFSCEGCQGFDPSGDFPQNLRWNAPGLKVVSLSVVTDEGCTGTFTDSILVTPKPRAAFSVQPQVTCPDTPVELLAESDNLPPGSTYRWSCTGCVDLPETAGPHSIAFANPGTESISLTVETPDGCVSEQTRQQVQINPIPTATFTLEDDALCTQRPAVLRYTGSASGLAAFTWNCDGCVGLTGNSGPGPHSIFWNDGGRKTLTLQVEDRGCVSEIETVVREVTFLQVDLGSNSPICEGETLQLTATPLPSSIYSWTGPEDYESTEASPVLNDVRSIQSGVYSLVARSNGCISEIQTTEVVILPAPLDVEITGPELICPGEVLRLEATELPNTVYAWQGPAGFDTSQRVALINPASVDDSGTYSLVASIGSCSTEVLTASVEVQFVPPPVPDTNPLVRCNPGPITFTASQAAPGTEVLLRGASGSDISALDTEVPYELTYIANQQNSSTGLRLIGRSAAGCESTPVPVEAVVVPVPQTPAETSLTRCEAGPVNIRPDMGIPSGDRALLFTQASGGTAIATNDTAPFVLTVPQVDQTSTYYLQSSTQNTCFSQRSPVVVRVAQPVPAVVEDTERCGPGPLTFTVTSSPIIAAKLYLQEDDAAPLITRFNAPYTLSTFQLTETTTFHISTVSPDGCESRRVPVVGEVNYPMPPQSDTPRRCGSGRLTFTLEGLTGDEIVSLYTQPLGGLAVAVRTGPPYELTTPEMQTTTTFYAEVSEGGSCISARTPLEAVILNPVPELPVVPVAERCGPGPLTFTLQNPDPAATRYLVFDANGLVTAVPAPTTTLTIPDFSTTTTYFIQGENEGNGCRSPRTETLGQRRAIPPPPEVPDVYRCGEGAVTVKVPLERGNDPVAYLYDAPVGGTLLDTDGMAPFELRSNFIRQTTTLYVAVSNDLCPQGLRSPVVIQTRPFLAVDLNITDADWNSNGSLEVAVTGGYPPYRYALNSATEFQTEPRFENLSPGTYFLWVRDARNCVYSTEVMINRRNCVSPAVIDIRTEDNGAGRLRATWQAVPEAVAYEYQWQPVGAADWSTLQTTTDTRIEFEALLPETDYYLRLRTRCGPETYSSWALAGFTTPRCNAVNFVFSQQVTGTSAEVFWSSMLGSDFYEFAWREQLAPRWQPTEIRQVANRSFSNLTPGTTYDVRVRGMCNLGSVRSDYVYGSFTTQRCSPARNLVIQDITAREARISWLPQLAAQDYLLRLRPAGGSWNDYPVTGTTYTFRNLAPDTRYEVRLSTRCGFADSGEISLLFRTRPADVSACNIPGGIVVREVNLQRAEVSWTPVPAAASYMVRYRRLQGNWTNINTGPDNRFILPLSTPHVYEVQVRAICGQAVSDWSLSQQFATRIGRNAAMNAVNAPLIEDRAALYPNPNPGRFTLLYATDQAGKLAIEVTDLAGRSVYHTELPIEPGHQELALQTSDLPDGVYFVQIEHLTSGQQSRLRMLIRR